MSAASYLDAHIWDVPQRASAEVTSGPLGGRTLQAAPVDASAGVIPPTGAATKTPKKDQTIDPIDTWVSHHLSRCPEEPGQDASGPAAAAETQPCSTGEARSAVTGGVALRALRPSTPKKTTAAPAATGRRS